MHRHHTATAALTAALVLALAALLAGCGGSTPAPPPDPTPTPSASPSRTPPAMPDAATRHTKAGALAFAKHYIELINYAQATGDTSALRATEAKRCKSCASGRRYLRGVYTAGGSISGGAWEIAKTLAALPKPGTHGFNVDLVVKFGPQVVRRPSRTQHLKGGTLPITIFEAPANTGWEVREWTRAR